MIKKLSLLVLIAYTYTSHADQLSDAIRASDLRKVTALLSEQNISEKQMIKYFDLAEQTIRTRREEAHITQIRPIFEDSRATKYSRRAVFSFLASAALGTPVLCAMGDYYDANKSYTKRNLCAITVLANFAVFFASFITTAICVTKAQQQYRQKCFALYHDSVRIKELLYDYELSLSDTK
ncbi:MAG: hypothetical protein M1114_04160 [Candidatus Dependentiae bacterium]|nr:hypothetical protein [Candidatus Dependentiae bacterium]